MRKTACLRSSTLRAIGTAIRISGASSRPRSPARRDPESRPIRRGVACSQLPADARLALEQIDLILEVAGDRLTSATAPQDREDGSPLGVFQCHRKRGVPGEGAEDEADDRAAV